MDGNWASRIACRGCSSPASRTTQHAARQAAAKHKAAADATQRGSGWPRSGAGGGNGSGNGNGNRPGDQDFAQLKKQVAELLRSDKSLQDTMAASRLQRQPQPEDDSMEEDQLPSMDSLRKLLQANEEAYGKDSVLG